MAVCSLSFATKRKVEQQKHTVVNISRIFMHVFNLNLPSFCAFCVKKGIICHFQNFLQRACILSEHSIDVFLG